ncbi:MAG: SCO family protein [Gemmatimonadales bacterium]|nr:MAG: SCO family protein [Gemmatimonadales bacterium]
MRAIFGPPLQNHRYPGDDVKQHFLARPFQLLTGVILGLAGVFLILRPGANETEVDPKQYVLSDPLPAPIFTLTSHRGEPVSSTDFPDRLLAVFFGYTFCPDVCPLTLSNLSLAFQELGEAATRIQLLFISVDPGRDTPERLGQYLAAFNASFVGLTGAEEEIREVANAFGVFFARSGEGEDYTVDHTARTFVIDPAGRIPLTFPVTATPEEMARDFTLLLGEFK